MTPENADRLLQEITSNSQTLAPEADASADADADESMLDISNEKQAAAPKPLVALVPFANPLADEKVAKKVFKTVKKGTRKSYLYHHYTIKPLILPHLLTKIFYYPNSK